MDISLSDEVLPHELLDFLEILIAFIDGRTSFVYETNELAYDTAEIATRRRVTIPPGYQDNWACVL